MKWPTLLIIVILTSCQGESLLDDPARTLDVSRGISPEITSPTNTAITSQTLKNSLLETLAVSSLESAIRSVELSSCTFSNQVTGAKAEAMKNCVGQLLGQPGVAANSVYANPVTPSCIGDSSLKAFGLAANLPTDYRFIDNAEAFQALCPNVTPEDFGISFSDEYIASFAWRYSHHRCTSEGEDWAILPLSMEVREYSLEITGTIIEGFPVYGPVTFMCTDSSYMHGSIIIPKRISPRPIFFHAAD